MFRQVAQYVMMRQPPISCCVIIVQERHGFYQRRNNLTLSLLAVGSMAQVISHRLMIEAID